MEILYYVMVFSGSALMVYNIIRYFFFVRAMQNLEHYSIRRALLWVPGIFLVLFLVGYVLVGFLGNKDLIVSSILLGGSIFVFLLLAILFYIVTRIRAHAKSAEARYAETEKEVEGLSKGALAYFRVNLTKNVILSVGGVGLYPSDRVGAPYDDILAARSPDMVSRFHLEGSTTFIRKDLLAHFAQGHYTASEIVLARRDRRHASFVRLSLTMAEEPGTGDVIGFLVESDYNEKMILDTILNRAMSFRYDIVCSIIDGTYDLIASGQQEGAKAILPKEALGSYEDFCKAHVLPRLPADEDAEKAMRSLDLGEIGKALANQTSYETDVRIAYQGQTYYKRFTFYNVTSDVQFFVLLVQDTTAIHRERAKQNERLSLALEQARQASAAKTVFFSNMSHDIRTPMNAIVGFTAMAKKSDDVEKVHHFLDKIESSSAHLLSLINDVLEMSRIESGKTELVLKDADLESLLGEVRDLFHNQMEAKGLDFRVTTEKLVHRRVMIDGFRFNRILLNLLSNALKYTQEGFVSVTLSEVPCDKEGYASYEIVVEDTGVGMSQEFADRIFEAYEREKKSTINEIQGTGLGMAITKSLVELMGGTIDVRTEEGKGTAFRIHLSFVLAAEGEDAQGQEGTAEAEGAPEKRFEGKRVLLADDNDINLEIAHLLLEEKGFAVEEAHNGQEAADKLFAAPAGTYDVILMDVQMPVMDGLEATRLIRSHKDPRIAATPIVAFTADAFAEDVQATKDAGMDAHLTKPIDVKAMDEVFSRLLGK